ncbi:uncharacterized protein BT62DRAFT_911669 [Guyanagaster necrorhizus]|uniref:Zn(2)-C6 fungal-type domain-containing protein n=1 Tax=Guyanagaster necrorhizus TaxID=856835 RepID=A0A9P8ALA6_9AGAR|nr:uncharacterized protein BT62DRAFT_911669 [Guyanagaster necrorhizus MCA 3950]KAG7440028.1 hypothetical protein BT62DRAFT_911669 [Guyanagaster necrorhizus MCA 3950]
MQNSLPYYQSESSTHVIDLSAPSTSSFALDSIDSRPKLRPPAHKKRKIDRACDACRRRKTKCDGPKMPDNVCTNCMQSRKACTYVEMSKPRGPPKAYVVGLEDRLEKMEDLLKRLWPESDFSEDLGPPVIRDSWKNEESANSADNATSQSKAKSTSFNLLASSSSKKPVAAGALFSPSVPLGFSTHLMLSDLRPQKRPRVPVRKHSSGTHGSHHKSEANVSDPSSDVDELVEGFEGKGRLSLRLSDDISEEDNFARFHGQSSSLRMVDATRKFKHLHMLDTGSDSGKGTPSPGFGPDSPRRPEFWRPPPWERLYEGIHVDSPEILPEILAQFPPPDLATKLVDIYFCRINIQFPLLHRPTFDRQWRENLQNRNIWFACLALTIFAVASRSCDDPRVLPKGVAKKENEEVDWTKAGWTYFTVALGVHRHRRSLLYPATLLEVQTFSLLAMFLRGTSSHPTAWMLISVGIRKAQDVGAHRRTVYQQKPTVQEELWKRAFWMLIAFDRIGSAHIGRPCGVGEEDFDVDLPVEVDDAYWEPEDPSMAFQQPQDVPCTITAFNLFIKLSQIVAFTTRTIYATNPANVIMGRPIGRPDQIVSQLNAALTEWVDSVPDYLKWSSQLENSIYSNLSATLYTAYYLTQMLIYRPFIPSPAACDGRPSNSTSSFPFPALAICTNAAKSCAHIVEEQMLQGLWNIPNLISISHISCGVLLVGIWDLKAKERVQLASGIEDIKPPLVQALEPLMKDISIFLKALEWAAPRYETVEPIMWVWLCFHLCSDLYDMADDKSRNHCLLPTGMKIETALWTFGKVGDWHKGMFLGTCRVHPSHRRSRNRMLLSGLCPQRIHHSLSYRSNRLILLSQPLFTLRDLSLRIEVNLPRQCPY